MFDELDEQENVSKASTKSIINALHAALCRVVGS